MKSKILGLLAAGLLTGPLTADAATYYVRANMTGSGLYVDSQTSLVFEENGSKGYALVTADLSDGTLRAVSQAIDPSNSLTSWVELGDTITVNGVTTPTTVTLQMRVTGTISGAVPQVFSFLHVGDSLVCTSGLSGVCSLVNPGELVQGFWSSSPSTVDQLFSIDIPLTSADSTFAFYARIIASTTGPDGVADFGNTARFSLILPEGLSFSSGSGVFLSANRVVPEPGTLALLGLGLAGLGLSRRRKAN